MVISLGLLWSAPAHGNTTDTLKVQTLLAEGDVFYGRFDNLLALTAYRKAFSIDSTSYDVLSRLARTATDLGKDFRAENQDGDAEQYFLEAMKYAESLEKQYSENAKTHFYLALVKGNLALFRGGKQKVAFGREIEMHCRQGLSLDSTDAQILAAYGIFNREIAGLSWMERAFAQALFGRVPAGSKEEAVRLLSRAVEINPELHVAQFELALSLIAVGQSEKAIPHLRLAQTLPAQTTQDNRNRQLANRMLERIAQ